MLLTHNQILKLLRRNVVQNAWPELVNGTSLDITLGSEILVEVPGHRVVYPVNNQPLCTRKLKLALSESYPLAPGDFILACSLQIFNIPLNISCEYKQKSTLARTGLDHLHAAWCDPGWYGSSLTLELKNVTRYHTIMLQPGMRIGQVVFYRHRHVREEHSYRQRGRYNHNVTVSGVRPPKER